MATNREVFDFIAQSWYDYRHHTRFRKELTKMADRWQGGKLLNVGCGHGPDFIPFAGRFELHGVDFSQQMIKLAGKYAVKFKFEANLLVAEAQWLPYRDGAFDRAIAVASYHHIKGKEQRMFALKELRRVLKKDSEVFITLWNRWQPVFWFKGTEVIVPWKTRAGKLNRYYYLYTYFEIEAVLEQAGFDIVSIYPERAYKLPLKYFSRNICVLARAR
jgi:tRNA (uracil-5-)-methyltransferase TRM9